jgi:hypothetical protein
MLKFEISINRDQFITEKLFFKSLKIVYNKSCKSGKLTEDSNSTIITGSL